MNSLKNNCPLAVLINRLNRFNILLNLISMGWISYHFSTWLITSSHTLVNSWNLPFHSFDLFLIFCLLLLSLYFLFSLCWSIAKRYHHFKGYNYSDCKFLVYSILESGDLRYLLKISWDLYEIDTISVLMAWKKLRLRLLNEMIKVVVWLEGFWLWGLVCWHEGCWEGWEKLPNFPYLE